MGLLSRKNTEPVLQQWDYQVERLGSVREIINVRPCQARKEISYVYELYQDYFCVTLPDSMKAINMLKN